MDLSDVKGLYEESLKKYGVDSRGVGWNTKESQILRFQKLLQVLDSETSAGGGAFASMI